MTHSLRRGIALLACAVLSGCATVPQQPFPSGRMTPGRTIGLLNVVEPAEYAAANVGGAAFAFGLVGGLVQGQRNKKQSEQFKAALGEDFSVARGLQQQLTQKLQARGYQVVSGVEPDADVLLEVFFLGIGFLSEPNSLSYAPYVRVSARAVERRSNERLYFQSFAYGEKWGTAKGIVLLPAAPGSSVSSFAALIDKPKPAAETLQNGVDAIASRIAAAFP